MKIEFGFNRKKVKDKTILVNIMIALFVSTYIVSEYFTLEANMHNFLVFVLTVFFSVILYRFDQWLDRRKGKRVNKRKIAFKYSFKISEILIIVIPFLYFASRDNFTTILTIDLMMILMIPLYLVIKLNVLGRIIKKYSFKNITMYKVDNMTGEEFETYLEMLFDHIGYKVYRTQLSGDFGADLVIENSDGSAVVQAKRYSKKVGVTAVQEVVTAKKYYECKRAYDVTNNYYTKPAKELAKVNKVILYDREWLEINVYKKMNHNIKSEVS